MTYEIEQQPLINKQLALRLVLEAKSAHLKWLAYALALTEQIDCPHECAPLSPTECEFGIWYYGHGKQILGDTVFYQSLEAPHEILHSLYGKIHALVKSERLDEARKHLPSLREISNILLEALAYLEKEINSMPPRD